MRAHSNTVLAAFVGLSLLLAVLLIRYVHGPRVVGRAVGPGAVEMVILQKCNWSGEPFTTSFVYRKPGGGWRWFYFNHQDNFWVHAGVQMDTNQHRAIFYRNNAPAVTFDWEAEVYTLHRRQTTSTNGEPLPARWQP